MPPVGRADLVVIVEVGAHPGGHGLLPHVQVQEPGQPVLLREPAGGFLEVADPHHAPVQIQQCLWTRIHANPLVARLQRASP